MTLLPQCAPNCRSVGERNRQLALHPRYEQVFDRDFAQSSSTLRLSAAVDAFSITTILARCDP
jgi:hypothetical protein